MGVKLQSALGGSVELNAPSTASNFTMTVPTTNGTVATTDQLQNFRNKIINGDMRIAQRGTSFTHTNTSLYPVDRIQSIAYNTGYTPPTGGTVARVQLTDSVFDGGTQFSHAIRLTPNTSWKLNYLWQKIEDVTQFSNTTVTLSFYGRVGSGTFKPTDGSQNAIRIEQDFGSGGSSSVSTYANWSTALTTSWQRIVVTVSLPSISGKTIGAGNCLNVMIYNNSDLSSVSWMEITGLQLETGSVATPFERRPIGAELALCQRYYQQYNTGQTPQTFSPSSNTTSATLNFKVSMRAIPSIVNVGTGAVQVVSTESITTYQGSITGWYNPAPINVSSEL
jgi:hypothetical protein